MGELTLVNRCRGNVVECERRVGVLTLVNRCPSNVVECESRVDVVNVVQEVEEVQVVLLSDAVRVLSLQRTTAVEKQFSQGFSNCLIVRVMDGIEG